MSFEIYNRDERTGDRYSWTRELKDSFSHHKSHLVVELMSLRGRTHSELFAVADWVATADVLLDFDKTGDVFTELLPIPLRQSLLISPIDM